MYDKSGGTRAAAENEKEAWRRKQSPYHITMMTPTLLLLPPPEPLRGDSQYRGNPNVWWKRNLPLRIEIAVASIFQLLQVISRAAVCIAASSLDIIGALLRILPGPTNPMEVLKNAAAKIYNIFRRKLVGGKGDPFEILGLEGKDKATIEDAVKARRKLALKYHPGEHFQYRIFLFVVSKLLFLNHWPSRS